MLATELRPRLGVSSAGAAVPPSGIDRRIANAAVLPPFEPRDGCRPEPGATFKRNKVVELDMPPIRRVANAMQVLFERADPAPR